MNYQVIPETRIVPQVAVRRNEALLYRFPSVSIFMPFNPKMEKKSKLVHSLSKATDKVAGELRLKYPGEMGQLVIQKLNSIIRMLDFTTHKASIAIFVSPVFERVYYLNMELEEKVIVNESLQIGDLLRSKKQAMQFHAVLLNEDESRIYLNDSVSFIRIKHNVLNAESADQPEVSEDEAHKRQHAVIEKSIPRVNHSLDLLLAQDHQPVVVFGKEKQVDQFKESIKTKSTVFEYVIGNFDEYSFNDFKELLSRDYSNWQRIRQKYLIQLLRNAKVNKKLSLGMADVRRVAINRGGRLLLIGRRYQHDSGIWIDDNMENRRTLRYNRFSNVKNLFDEMVEKVLESGGDVELIDDDLLAEFDQMALIKN